MTKFVSLSQLMSDVFENLLGRRGLNKISVNVTDMSAKAMLSHKTDNWATPPKFYEELNARFSFDPFDPCPLNCKGDGRVVDWIGDTIFVNPPYSKLKTTNKGGIGWVELCHNKCQDGKTIVMLIPARTCTSWFHDIILKHGYAVEFVRGRLKFGDGTTSAPFPSMLVIMKPKK